MACDAMTRSLKLKIADQKSQKQKKRDRNLEELNNYLINCLYPKTKKHHVTVFFFCATKCFTMDLCIARAMCMRSSFVQFISDFFRCVLPAGGDSGAF